MYLYALASSNSRYYYTTLLGINQANPSFQWPARVANFAIAVLCAIGIVQFSRVLFGRRSSERIDKAWEWSWACARQSNLPEADVHPALRLTSRGLQIPLGRTVSPVDFSAPTSHGSVPLPHLGSPGPLPTAGTIRADLFLRCRELPSGLLSGLEKAETIPAASSLYTRRRLARAARDVQNGIVSQRGEQ